jgi:DNA-binding transcriptional MocR family regulator
VGRRGGGEQLIRARRFGDRVEQITTGVGLHHTILFRDARADADAIAERASARGVSVQPLRAYGVRNDVEGIALGYGGIDAGAIAEGVRILADVVRRSLP